MALTTTNQKLAVMEWGVIWEPGLPISPGALDQADQQQLLWDNPVALWGAAVSYALAPLVYSWMWDKCGVR